MVAKVKKKKFFLKPENNTPKNSESAPAYIDILYRYNISPFKDKKKPTTEQSDTYTLLRLQKWSCAIGNNYFHSHFISISKKTMNKSLNNQIKLHTSQKFHLKVKCMINHPLISTSEINTDFKMRERDLLECEVTE